MRTLHVYLLRQLLGTLGLTVGVFTFFILVVTVLNEIVTLLMSHQVAFGAVGQAIGLLIPHVMVFALPMGMLTAALLVFGRLSADHEITAMRASGVSLVGLVMPVLGLSVLLSAAAALFNLELAPRCRTAYKKILREVGTAKATALIPERTYIKDFADAIVYVGKVTGPYLEDVLIYQLKRDRVESHLRADRGQVTFSHSNDLVYVQLTNVYHIFYREDRQLPQTGFVESEEFIYTNTVTRKESKAELDNMTFTELRRELEQLERKMSEPLKLERPASQVKGEETTDERKKAARNRTARRADLTLPVRVQMHKQVAFSFACIGFTLVGIPLGIRAHRRETSFSFAVAIGLVLIYYSFFIVGLAQETRPELAPHLILWIPNFLFQVIGGLLLWRANRGK